ncbi:hypothetical protein [Dysgonomonas sp. BGC7]|uniref:hypothetical protein n=1 Tax=Dysgonomonas sp. BGC7 TaxID=1658008 RepID=UPI00068169E1|nr:hypothetical protein [Dysgonomonas sp. BGC7]MBD8390119.1 hypothetical protein [Dysgonomonas sp. BGC7]
MKKFIVAFALLIGATSLYNTVEAQSVNISVNIGRQPAWGPVGYDYVNYYYFPDIDCYYDVNIGMFYYYDRGRWMSARYLPYGYRNYDLYGLYKVVLNVHEPWRYHRTHYRDYARYRGYRNQVVIRDSRDYRYHNSRNNRVVWYSNTRPASNNRDYNNRDRDYNNRDRDYNNRNRESRPQNNYNRDRSDDRRDNNRNRDYRSNDNVRSDRSRNSNDTYSSSRNRQERNRDNGKINRPSQSTRNNYRLASNSERNR